MSNENTNDNPIPEEPREPRNFSMEDSPGRSDATRRRRGGDIAGQSDRSADQSDETPARRGGTRRRRDDVAGQSDQSSDTQTDDTDGISEAIEQLKVIASSASTGANELRRMRQTGIAVDLNRHRRSGTPQILGWELIKQSTYNMNFNRYRECMDLVLCNDEKGLARLYQTATTTTGIDEDCSVPVLNKLNALQTRRFLPFTDTEAYSLLKIATEAFVTVNAGIPLDSFINSITPEEYEQILDEFDAADPHAGDDRVSDWWERYQVTVNGDNDPQMILPYLHLIQGKLNLPVRRNIFALECLSDIDRRAATQTYGILADKLLNPIMVELIWSYWHEEGMLVQTMGALGRRFQNVRGPEDRDPLAMVEMDPLRPLNNILWGYIQDEQHRLSVLRRAYEYSHHYGLTLRGKAVPSMRPADPRSRFLEAFHFLLHQCTQFFRQDDDTTIVADGFPVLNALRELHMILSEGAHNQFGDLPTTARIEMLMDQWILARPELREFLPRRIMVAYPEPWMDPVDSMKRLQGWGDTSILDFSFLANDGESLLLSVRYTAWTEINDAQLAGVWARMFRDEIQRYIHSYRSVTGVDLTAPIATTQDRELIAMLPSDLIQRRLKSGGNGTRALPAAQSQPVQPGLRERRAARQIARPR